MLILLMLTAVARSVRLSLCTLLPLVALGCAPREAPPPMVVDVSSGQTVAVAEPAPEPPLDVDERDDRPFGSVRGYDADADGIADKDDQCPKVPEDRDGFEDEDGCPDVDNDHDGIADVNDKCPNQPETKNGFEDEDGCPDANIDRAKRAFRAGATAFAQGDYAAACKFFEDAYQLEPRDPILYNLSVCYERLGDRNAACRAYKQWRTSPQGSTSSNQRPSLANCP